MPYITIHSIRTSLKKAIDYICRPEKTNNYRNIYSESCNYKTAHLVFEKTRRNKSPNTKTLAFHIIQSFPEGEVTVQQAMEIGQETINRFLGGEYELVLATHTDTNKIHTHMIINSVNMINSRSFSREHDRKNDPAWKQLYNISNQIAKEHGLSVIDNALDNSVSKSRSYVEWYKDKQGTSWKSQLKNIIDDTIRTTNNFESFIVSMRSQNITVRYEPYKTKNGMILAFKMPGQKYFIYSQKLGKYYHEDNIKRRIERSIRHRSMTATERRQERILNDNGELKKLFNVNEFDSISLQKWAQHENRKIQMQTLNLMRDKGFSSAYEVNNYISELRDRVSQNNDMYSELKKMKNEFTIQKKYAEIYHENKESYNYYKNSTYYPDQYFREHESEILLFEEAKSVLEKHGISEPNIEEISSNLEKIEYHINKCYQHDRELYEELESLDTLSYNLGIIYEDMPVRQAENEPTERQTEEQKKRRTDDFEMEL